MRCAKYYWTSFGQCSLYSTPRCPDVDPDLMDIDAPVRLEDITVTEEKIVESIKEIPVGSAPGSDGIPPLLLKQCSQTLKLPLKLLWEQSMKTGIIPIELKEGLIIPVHKGDSRSIPKNYRPVTLTSHLIKLFERVVVKEIVTFMGTNSLFNEKQHGFRAGRSCLSQLLEHYQGIISLLETGSSADTIYLDFAKAFDKVDHGLLIRKMRAMGVGGGVLRWIYGFLSGRKQSVAVGDSVSSADSVVSGVPQGTVLGPILFLIFIGDIDKELTYAHASSFADDTRVVCRIEESEDYEKMQSELCKIYEWADANNMKFNASKFEHLRYGPSDAGIRELFAPGYFSANHQSINNSEAVKDLGIIMSCSTHFDDHIEDRSRRGRRMAGWVFRTFATREKEPMILLYKSLVLPILEYCCQLWSPTKLYLIRKLEAVQRNFTARLVNMTSLNYWERLVELGLYSLERRRDRYIILYIWKILQGLVPNFQDDEYKVVELISPRRGRLCVVPPLKSGVSASVRTIKDDSFAVRGPRLFNAVDKSVRDFDGTLLGFKKRLDSFLRTVPDRPVLPQYRQSAHGNGLIDQMAQLRAENVTGRPL